MAPTSTATGDNLYNAFGPSQPCHKCNHSTLNINQLESRPTLVHEVETVSALNKQLLLELVRQSLCQPCQLDHRDWELAIHCTGFTHGSDRSRRVVPRQAQGPSTQLTDVDRDGLAKVLDHFKIGSNRPEVLQVSSEDEEEPRAGKRKRKRPCKRNSWRAFMNIKELNLAPTARAMLNINGSEQRSAAGETQYGQANHDSNNAIG